MIAVTQSCSLSCLKKGLSSSTVTASLMLRKPRVIAILRQRVHPGHRHHLMEHGLHSNERPRQRAYSEPGGPQASLPAWLEHVNLTGG